MTDRAALYRVAVRRRSGGGEPLPLGDLDGAGTSLADVLAGLLDGFADERRRRARRPRPHRRRDERRAVRRRPARPPRRRRRHRRTPAARSACASTPDDLQLVRCGCLFRLPATATAGTLAVQLAYGRGVKGLFEQGLAAALPARRLPGLALALDRLADPRHAPARGRRGPGRAGAARPRRARPGRDGAETASWVAAGRAGTGRARGRRPGHAGAGARPDAARALPRRRRAGASPRSSPSAASPSTGRGSASGCPTTAAASSTSSIPRRRPPGSRGRSPASCVDRAGEPTDASLLAALRAAVAVGSHMLGQHRSRSTSGTTSAWRPTLLEPGAYGYFAGGANDELTLGRERRGLPPLAAAAARPRRRRRALDGDDRARPRGGAAGPRRAGRLPARRPSRTARSRMARAAAAAGTIMCLSTFATATCADVAAAGGRALVPALRPARPGRRRRALAQPPPQRVRRPLVAHRRHAGARPARARPPHRLHDPARARPRRRSAAAT